MKKQILTLIVLTAVATLPAAADESSSFPAQPEFPQIISQPEDQMVDLGSNATFSVTAENADAYQWLRGGNSINSQTNNSLTITNVGVNDVGFYSCDVYKDSESVPTRAASLMVFTSSIDPQTGVDPIVVFGPPVVSGGSQGNCPGHYTGFVSYTKTIQQGWGWAPDTTGGNNIFTATDTNRTDTKIQYVGEYGDGGCNQSTVSLPTSPVSPVYRFGIYFTNNVPTNAYPITLNGFKP